MNFNLGFGYKEHKFETKKEADEKAREMKKEFGYRPEVFQLTKRKTGERHFAVIEPNNLYKVKDL